MSTTLPARRPWRDPRPVLGGVTLAMVAGAAVVLFAQWGPDWPAQQFRAWSAAQHGITAWTNQWYGGHPLLGYSVLYPAAAIVLGAAGTGLVAIVATTWLARPLAPAGATRAALFHLAVAVSLIESLLIGQVPFLLGTMFGAAALARAFGGGRRWLIAAAAAACALSSPLAGLCLAIATPAVLVRFGWRRGLWLAPSLIGIGVSAVAGGAGGRFAFPLPALLTVAGFCGMCVAMTRGRSAATNAFAASYLVASVAVFLVPNPVGGNIVRLGTTIVLPLAVRFVPVSRTVVTRVASTLLLAVAGLWPSWSCTAAVAHGATDQSQHEVYYAGLLAFLRRQDPRGGRIEIPFTREHWETYYVATQFPIARGWERQTDLQYDDVLYHALTPTAYRAWLDDNAVAFVALPDAPIDYGGKSEAALLADPPSYLRPVWHDAEWSVWRVVHPTPIVTGPATLTDIGTDSITIDVERPGTVTVHVRNTGLWRVADGSACVRQTSHGWLQLAVRDAGTLRLAANGVAPRTGTDLTCS